MSVSYKALLPGYLSPIDILKTLTATYAAREGTVRLGMGDGHYILDFCERWPPEYASLSWFERRTMAARAPKDHLRALHMFTDGCCAGDYADVTTKRMTLLTLGRWGECEEIMAALTDKYGGYICNEAEGEEWRRVSHQSRSQRPSDGERDEPSTTGYVPPPESPSA